MTRRARFLALAALATLFGGMGGALAPAHATRVCVGGDDRQEPGRMVGFCIEDPGTWISYFREDPVGTTVDIAEDARHQTENNVEIVRTEVENAEFSLDLPPIPPTP